MLCEKTARCLNCEKYRSVPASAIRAVFHGPILFAIFLFSASQRTNLLDDAVGCLTKIKKKMYRSTIRHSIACCHGSEK